MRYYKIVIHTDTSTSSVTTRLPGSQSENLQVTAPHPRIWESGTNGVNNPGALQVEFDLPVAPASMALPGGHVEIVGVSLTDVSAATKLQGRLIKVYGGMARGLPLADPRQQGLLVSGYIQEAWGNWLGTQMSINMILIPRPSPPSGDGVVNLVLDWQPGQPLADAIRQTLTVAYPGTTVRMNISDNLVQNYHEPGYYSSLGQFSDFVRARSRAIIKTPGYAGVQIVHVEDSFNVFDGSTLGAAKTIAFTDLIGQPTWVGQAQVQIQCVLRGDISVGDQLTLPTGITAGYGVVAGVTFQTGTIPSQRSIFTGTFTVKGLRHIGDFRNPDGGAWVTVIDLVQNVPAVAKAAVTTRPAGSSSGITP